jgi:hypothetical protein
MKRCLAEGRDRFELLVGASAALEPLAARAQLPALLVIGYLDPGPPEAGANFGFV